MIHEGAMQPHWIEKLVVLFPSYQTAGMDHEEPLNEH